MKANLKETIRNEYVHGYINALGQRVMPTLDALIAKYKVPSSTIYRTSSKDKWKDQRNTFRDKLREEIDGLTESVGVSMAQGYYWFKRASIDDAAAHRPERKEQVQA